MAVGSGCASRARTAFEPDLAFSGPKKIVVRGSDRWVDMLEANVKAYGFKVGRRLPSTTTPVPGRYIFEIRGFCPEQQFGKFSEESQRDLEIIGYEVAGNERIAKSTLINNGDCPGEFFSDFAASLDRRWSSIHATDSAKTAKAADEVFEKD